MPYNFVKGKKQTQAIMNSEGEFTSHLWGKKNTTFTLAKHKLHSIVKEDGA